MNAFLLRIVHATLSRTRAHATHPTGRRVVPPPPRDGQRDGGLLGGAHAQPLSLARARTYVRVTIPACRRFLAVPHP